MKKSLLLSTALAFALMSGCGGSSSSIAQKQDTISTTTPKESIFDSSLLLSSLAYEKSTRAQNENKVRYDGELNFMGGCDTKDYVLIDNAKSGDVTIYDNGFYTYKSNNFDSNDSFSYKVDINSTCPAVVVNISNETNQTLPTQASNLNITTTECDGTYEITWQDNSDNEDGFVLYLDDKPVKIISSDIQFINIEEDLNENQVYTLDIAAKNQAGSSISDTVKFKIVDSKVILIRNPTLLGKIPAAEKSWVAETKLSKDEKIAYVLDVQAGLEFVDISNVTNPKVLNALDIQGTQLKISEDETKAFVLANEELNIVDITDVNNPKIIGSIELYYRRSFTVFDHGTKVCVSGAKEDSIEHLGLTQIIDISDPTAPKIIGSVETESYSKSYMKISDDETKVYVPTGNTTFDVVDISDNEHPKVVSKIDALKLDAWGDEVVGLYGLPRDGNTVYAKYSSNADGVFYTGVQIVDITYSKAPRLLGYIELKDIVRNLALSKDKTKLFISNDEEGMLTYDVSAFQGVF